jgi:hypothetical protein
MTDGDVGIVVVLWGDVVARLSDMNVASFQIGSVVRSFM